MVQRVDQYHRQFGPRDMDVVVDVTGSVEFGLQVALEPMNHGENLVMTNVGLDTTLGPRWARRW